MSPYLHGANNTTTLKALLWTDLTPKEVKQKRWITIALVAATIIVAIGITVAIYYCCTTTTTATDAAGKSYQSSNAVWTVFPGMVGGTALFFLAGAGIVWQIDHGREHRFTNKGRLYQDLQSSARLSQAYSLFYKEIRPLLLQGMLSMEEAKELRSIFQEYEKTHVYTSLSAVKKADVKANPDLYPQYTAIRKARVDLKARWKRIYDYHFANSEYNSTFKGEVYSLSANPERDMLMAELRVDSQTLEEAYENFHERIELLVQKQIISTEEASTLRSIFVKYESLLPLKKQFDDLIQSNVVTAPQLNPDYVSNQRQLQQLEGKLQAFYQELFPTSEEDEIDE